MRSRMPLMAYSSMEVVLQELYPKLVEQISIESLRLSSSSMVKFPQGKLASQVQESLSAAT